jgi:two-component system, cell cycle response regulator DivK
VAKGSRGMKTTLLLVEDSRFQRIEAERILLKAGYTVLNAADGEEGLRVARERVPDLVVLDLLLPKLDGPHVLQALKEGTSTEHIPVIALTSLPEANEERLRKAGAAGFFCKTRLFEDKAEAVRFIDLIEQVLDKSREQKAMAPASE